MEWMERLNMAMKYIEEHLTEEADYEKLGKIAGCSAYHFQRMFSYMAGVPLAEYIRRRKMSLAATELLSGAKVLDVALKYGYDSPTAFNRAFQKIQGAAPSEIKAGGANIKAFPPISFKITIKGEAEMNYRIEKKEAFRIIGVSEPLEKEIEKNFETVPQMWQKAAMDGTVLKLSQLIKDDPKAILGVSTCASEDEWKYYISVANSDAPAGEFDEYVVPAATWAVFPGEGSMSGLQELEKRIVTEWLPNSGYEYGSAPDIEVYLNADPVNAKYEIWLPVVKKNEEL